MIHALLKTITNNLVLKCIGFIIGCSLWLMISSLHNTTTWIEVPLSFYNQDDTVAIAAPETIWVQLSGNRSVLRSIESNNLIAHINVQKLSLGKNPLTIDNHHLFLPDWISVVNYSPLSSCIEKSTH